MVDKNLIGQTAGKIWNTLAQKGKVKITELPRIAKADKTIASYALGWLAREDKIEFLTEGKAKFVTLTAKEKNQPAGS